MRSKGCQPSYPELSRSVLQFPCEPKYLEPCIQLSASKMFLPIMLWWQQLLVVVTFYIINQECAVLFINTIVAASDSEIVLKRH